jgi:hypothetical protein
MSRPHEDREPHELAAPAWEGEAPAEPLAAVERALAAVTPAPPRLDRDRLMFLAGAANLASGRRQPPDGSATSLDYVPEQVHPIGKLTLPARLAWPAAAAALAATSLALAIALLLRPAPAERIVYLPQPVRNEATPAAPNLDRPPVQPAALAAISRSSEREAPGQNYLQTRDVALRLGLDALGSLPGGGQADSPPATYRSLLDALSPMPRAASDAPESSRM